MPEWQDEGIVLGAKRYGENALIVSIFTPFHGRHLGLTYAKKKPLSASFITAQWKAKLPEQLGRFSLESFFALSAQFLDDKKRLACLACLSSLLDSLLPEREIQTDFYFQVKLFLSLLAEKDWLKNYIKLEASLLSILGFGMDLTHCAGGGDENNLAYVSPKTARAVSLEKGEPYKKQLLILPRFLWQDVSANEKDLNDGLVLTGFFLSKLLSKLPLTRGQMLAHDGK